MLRHGFATLFACALSPVVSSASFDCAKASTVTEKRICASERLSTLDEHLGRYYHGALIALGDGGACFKDDQRSWLGERNACQDDRCLEKQYMQRLSELDALQPGANSIENPELHSGPTLVWIIPPAQDEIAAPRTLAEKPATIEGRILNQLDEGGDLSIVNEDGELTALTLLMTADEHSVQRLIELASDEDQFRARGSRHVDEDGGAYFDPARCVFIYRLPVTDAR
jgi:uncharacterized protein